MYKADYEDDFMEQDIIINEKLADKLNGRCFLDTDMPERIEGFKFIKTKTGIDFITIGSDSVFNYSHVCHEDYGKYKVKDTFFGTDIILVETNFYLLREISEDVFNKMVSIINKQKDISDKIKNDWIKTQRQFFKEAKIH